MLELITILSLANMCVALTVTTSMIFAPFRAWNSAHAPGFIADLIHCPYCFGHWSAFALLCWSGLFRPQDFLIAWLAVTGLSALFSYAWLRLAGLVG
jgi:hypothetical protein